MPTGHPYNLTKEFLNEQYVTLDKSCRQIAKEINCDKKVIIKALKSFGFEVVNKNTIRAKALIGKRFDKLTVLSLAGATQDGVKIWNCQCSCKNKTLINVRYDSLSTGHTRSCGCKKQDVATKNLTRIGEISSTYWKSTINNAYRRGFEFLITKEYAWNLFLLQNRKCVLTGIFLYFDLKGKKRTASLDRIDSKIGYVEGNVQWVFTKVNMMKQHYSQEEFIDICIKVAKTQKQKEFTPSNFMLGI